MAGTYDQTSVDIEPQHSRDISVTEHKAKAAMVEIIPLSSYKNTKCPQIFKEEQTVLSVMSGQFHEFSLADYHVPTALSSKLNDETPTNLKDLSCEEIVRLAGAQYLRRETESRFVSPSLGTEDQHGLELVHLLYACADCISHKQYDQAASLLTQCRNSSSQWGSPVQRFCYYFSQALQERIERQTCGKLRNPPKPPLNFANNFNSGYNRAEFNQVLAFYSRVLPYVKLVQLTSVQAILDTVGNSIRIHVIDLEIRNGCQWSVLMQSLALRRSSYPIKLLRITAFGMDGDDLKDNGRRLHDLAQSLEIPFSYRMVQIKSREEIHQGMFNVRPGEAVAVFAHSFFHGLLHNGSLLEKVVDVIKRLKPRIMVIIEVEADTNSPSFDKRFVDVLFFSSASFDCWNVVIPDRHDPQRVNFEEMFLASQLRNSIACDGIERRVGHVKIDVWRSFFKHMGLREMSFSYQAWYQARLLLKEFHNTECYSIEANGDALITGWKNTPMVSISLWTCG